MGLDSLVVKKAPTACEGILTAVGMSGSVIFGVAIGWEAMSPFAAFGALIAMHITPRHGAWAKIVGALAGCLFLLCAASLSEIIGAFPFLALALLFALSWLAALPGKDLAYLGFVAKCAAVAVLLSYFDFKPSWGMALYFCGGVLLGILLSLANMAFEREDQKSPGEQLRALLHGDTNSLYFSLVVPITVVGASLLAKMLEFSNPAWVGLTVVYVASSNRSVELRRLLERIIGTVAGAFLAYMLLIHVQQPLQLALIIGGLAFLMPFAGPRYGVFSLLMTSIVLILLDIAMQPQGGDMEMLFWRCWDTALGCACVFASDLIRELILWLKQRSGKARGTS